MSQYMTPAEVIKTAKQPGRCYAFVKLTEDDGVYIEVKKSDLIFRIENFDANERIRAQVNKDGDLILN